MMESPTTDFDSAEEGLHKLEILYVCISSESFQTCDASAQAVTDSELALFAEDRQARTGTLSIENNEKHFEQVIISYNNCSKLSGHRHDGKCQIGVNTTL